MNPDVPATSPPSANTGLSAADAAHLPASTPAKAGVPLRHFPACLRLQQKTTLLLVIMLSAIVAVVGVTFYFSTRSMLQSAQNDRVRSFACGLAATLGDDSPVTVQIDFNALERMPDLEFVVLTDAAGTQVASHIADDPAWRDYHTGPQSTPPDLAASLGGVREFSHHASGRTSSVVVVPVFHIGPHGKPAGLAGYLHASFATDTIARQLHSLGLFVLLTCMAVMLLAIPIASLIARNITIPIQRLARAAHALAQGDLSHRVSLGRRDELGELADAFNRMANTVQRQQEDIRQINAGLERNVLQRTAELEDVNLRLHAEIAEKEDFLRAVSHDLNAPLRNIAGMASMLAIKYADTLEKDALQRLDRIQKNVQVECELINELLELSRIKTRREKIETVDLHELVRVVADGFSGDLETRGITLRIMSRLPVMRGEKLRLRQIFLNLIDNAIKYMRTDGPREILIRSDAGKNEVLFSVADTGMGIAPEDLPRLFHVFRRAKNASVMKVPGKGVGLASVKSIIENYHGRLWVQSTPDQGTTFLFAIPLSHFELAAAANPDAVPPSSGESPADDADNQNIKNINQKSQFAIPSEAPA